MFACSNCEDTLYCSRECQKRVWKTHKKECTKKSTSTPATKKEPESAAAFILYFHLQHDEEDGPKAVKLCQKIESSLVAEHGFRSRKVQGSKASFEDGDFDLFASQVIALTDAAKGDDFRVKFLARMPITCKEFELTDSVIHALIAAKSITFPAGSRFHGAPHVPQFLLDMMKQNTSDCFVVCPKAQEYGSLTLPVTAREKAEMRFCLYFHVFGGIDAKWKVLEELGDEFDPFDSTGGQVAFDESSRGPLRDFKSFSTRVISAAKKVDVRLKFICRMPFIGIGLNLDDEMIGDFIRDEVIEFPPDTIFRPSPLSGLRPFEYGSLEFLTPSA